MYELTPKWQCKIPKNQRRKELFALKTLSVIEIFIQPENYVIYKCPFFFCIDVGAYNFSLISKNRSVECK